MEPIRGFLHGNNARKCNGRKNRMHRIFDNEVNANVDEKINLAWREWQPQRHTERRAGLCVLALREQEARTRTRRQRGRKPRCDVLVSDPEHPLGRNKTRCARSLVCKTPPEIERLMLASRNGPRMGRRRTRGRRYPRKAVSEGFLDRCMGRRWIHHVVSGMDSGRQSLQMGFLLHSCLILPWWPRGAIFGEPSPVLRRRRVARPGGCGLIQWRVVMVAEHRWSYGHLAIACGGRREDLRLDCGRGRLGTSVRGQSYPRTHVHTIQDIAFVI